MAETPNVCPTLHMPLQSGSDRDAAAMRRSYRAERYLGIIDRVRAAIPHAAITTDIIVGFPGETEEDFQATLDVVRQAAVRQRLHLPVLQAAGHPGRRAGRPGPQRRCVTNAISGSSSCRRRSRWRRTPRRSDAASSCWSPRARAVRTPPPPGCRAGPATAGWCTSHPAGLGDPARRRRHDDGHRRRAAPPDRRRRPLHPPAHPGRRCARRPAANRAPGSASACPASVCPARRRRSTGMCAVSGDPERTGDFDEFKGDIEAAERRVAREIDPGARALVVAVAGVRAAAVVRAAAHRRRTGTGRADRSTTRRPTTASRCRRGCSCWLALVFGVGFSMLALLTRRWAMAWIALAGSTVACVAGPAGGVVAADGAWTSIPARASG